MTHPQEGACTHNATVVSNRETVVSLGLGKPLARGYRKLLLEMWDRESQFEAYMLGLARDPHLQAAFLADPEQALRASAVLAEGEHLSRSNRLFIGLLANQEFLKLVRCGPQRIAVPDAYRVEHRERLERVSARIFPANRYISEASIQKVIQRRFYSGRIFESVLTDPTTARIYHKDIDLDYVRGLLDSLYLFSDEWQAREGVTFADPVIALDMMIGGFGMEGVGQGIYYVFSKASQDTDLGYGVGFGITQTTAIWQDLAIISKTYIFTETHVLCDLAPSPEVEPGVSDQFQYFKDFTVVPEFADEFQLEVFQVNEILNISRITDAMMVGMDIVNYEGALNAARERVLLTPP